MLGAPHVVVSGIAAGSQAPAASGKVGIWEGLAARQTAFPELEATHKPQSKCRLCLLGLPVRQGNLPVMQWQFSIPYCKAEALSMEEAVAWQEDLSVDVPVSQAAVALPSCLPCPAAAGFACAAHGCRPALPTLPAAPWGRRRRFLHGKQELFRLRNMGSRASPLSHAHVACRWLPQSQSP